MGGHLKPRVLVDCDGVLSFFTERLIQLINTELHTEYTVEDIDQWDFCAALGFDSKTAARIKRRVGATPGFAASLSVYPGAVEGMRKLQKMADVYIVTSPWNSNPTWASEREAWLKDHFGIPHSKVISTSAKHVCDGDVFIDDKVTTCEAWRAEYPAKRSILWRNEHNRKDPWDGDFTSSWDSVLALVEDSARRS